MFCLSQIIFTGTRSVDGRLRFKASVASPSDGDRSAHHAVRQARPDPLRLDTVGSQFESRSFGLLYLLAERTEVCYSAVSSLNIPIRPSTAVA